MWLDTTGLYHEYFTNSLGFFQASDEERLKQLNDEQLLKLLEEAYHSKKLDDKNKSAFFKVRIIQLIGHRLLTGGP
jgi:hypothetical protein